MLETLTVNGREYAWPRSPTAVLCIDGSEPTYIEQAIDAGVMPFMKTMLARGADLRADCVMPSFTNPNNLSIVTGVPPAVHGICGNYFLDSASGAEVMMNDPAFLRCGTILAAFAQAGARVAVVTAKDKLRALLGYGLPLAPQRTICLSAERADQATLQGNGIESVLEWVGLALPSVYSAALSEFVVAVGARLVELGSWDLLYLSTTDYIQHKYAPGTPAANTFYAMLDRYLARLDAAGAVLAITADHGMSAKHDANGRPKVIYLQTLLDEWLGEHRARVILPITDPYVVHHGALGGFAQVYLNVEDSDANAIERLRAVEGIMAVLPCAMACARFELPPNRQGDLTVLAEWEYALGTCPDQHDLSRLEQPLRSHGGITEQRVPMLLNRPCRLRTSDGPLRNFDAFHLALNRVQ